MESISIKAIFKAMKYDLSLESPTLGECHDGGSRASTSELHV